MYHRHLWDWLSPVPSHLDSEVVVTQAGERMPKQKMG